MHSFLSRTAGIGGTLKSQPEDFLVEEIAENGTVLELGKKIEKPDEFGKFVHFVLEKRNWSTTLALKEIAKRVRTSHRNFSFAGSKDKCAITTQLASGFRVNKEDLMHLNIRDIKINGAWLAKDKVRLGSLAGNRFAIKINGASDGAEEKVTFIHKELEGRFPNYFGEQRFGSSRKNTHLIGEKIIRGDFEAAALDFICRVEGEENEESIAARKELNATRDFKTALRSFPSNLKLERMMIAHLSDTPSDFIGAFLRLPRQLLLLFVHAFQSHIFNDLLSNRIREGEVLMEEGEFLCGQNDFGYPDVEKIDVDGWLCMKIIGYNSNPNSREKEILESLEIKKDDFRIKEIPEISSKGTFRTAFALLKDFGFHGDTFRFSLQSGSYATSALREFITVDKS